MPSVSQGCAGMRFWLGRTLTNTGEEAWSRLPPDL